MIAGWNRFWFSPGSARNLGICRALFFGMLFLWQVGHDFSPWGAYSDVFWMPIWLFDTLRLHPLSPDGLSWMQLVWKLSLLLSAIGLFSRAAMVTAFALGTYLMGLPHNFGQTQHFDTLVVFTTGALAISRAGDACSIDALLTRRLYGKVHGGRTTATPDGRRLTDDERQTTDDGEYTWPIRFVWVAMSLIFCAAGISKLRHSGVDWILSDNLSMLLLRQQYHLSDGEPLTNWGIWVANHHWVARGMAAMSVMVETGFPLVLFSRRARALLVPAGLAFLVGIRILMGPTFEQFMMCYVFWVPWDRVLAYNPWRHAFAPRARWSAAAADVPASADSELAPGH